jgi:hypothetical protein
MTRLFSFDARLIDAQVSAVGANSINLLFTILCWAKHFDLTRVKNVKLVIIQLLI